MGTSLLQPTRLSPELQSLPGYRLRRRLGHGAFAEVWEAQTKDDRTVALKFLPSDNGRSVFYEIKSLQTIRALDHPNLTRIDRIFSHQGYNVIAMERADGSLADLLEMYQKEAGCNIPPAHLIRLLAQAAVVLDFLNTRQHRINGQVVAIQHCDIKPANLLVFDDTLKLTDFGLSSWISCQMKPHRQAGTPDYAAPEVFQGRLSLWTDQYALAVSYCKLRGGRLPFSDTPPGFQADYVRPAPDLSMLTEEEQPVLLRALSPVPQVRWPSCKELIYELARSLGL